MKWNDLLPGDVYCSHMDEICLVISIRNDMNDRIKSQGGNDWHWWSLTCGKMKSRWCIDRNERISVIVMRNGQFFF